MILVTKCLSPDDPPIIIPGIECHHNSPRAGHKEEVEFEMSDNQSSLTWSEPWWPLMLPQYSVFVFKTDFPNSSFCSLFIAIKMYLLFFMFTNDIQFVGVNFEILWILNWKVVKCDLVNLWVMNHLWPKYQGLISIKIWLSEAKGRGESQLNHKILPMVPSLRDFGTFESGIFI